MILKEVYLNKKWYKCDFCNDEWCNTDYEDNSDFLKKHCGPTPTLIRLTVGHYNCGPCGVARVYDICGKCAIKIPNLLKKENEQIKPNASCLLKCGTMIKGG